MHLVLIWISKGKCLVMRGIDVDIGTFMFCSSDLALSAGPLDAHMPWLDVIVMDFALDESEHINHVQYR